MESVPDEELGIGDVTDDSGEEGQPEAPAVEQLVPSAFGMTFVLEEGCGRLEIVASWGQYSAARASSWRRHPGSRRRFGGVRRRAVGR